ncbi:MAG: hypothetical protein JWR85_3564 [Marmoricola sp.]|nr:hypothetical protein [Marmoricola sp.]
MPRLVTFLFCSPFSNMSRKFLTLAALLIAVPISAQEVGSDDYTYEAGVLVTASDVTTCPYRVVGPITIGVTEDYGADTRAKIFGKLRAKAIKAGADAVLLVAKGKTHMTAWAWNRREYTGRAVRYVDRACAPKAG